MRIDYDKIIIRNRLILHEGMIDIQCPGLYLICGTNGSGKSLLLSNINHHLSCDHVYQRQTSAQIFTGLSIKDNILLNNGDEDLLLDLTERYHLNSILDLNPKKLSGGEKRLVIFFRGVCTADAVILLDEPTNDLDYNTVKIMIEILEDICRKKVVFIVSHDDRIKRIASCIYEIENQKLVLKEDNRTIHEKTSLSLLEPEMPVRRMNIEHMKKIFSRHIILTIVLLLLFIVSCSINSGIKEKASSPAADTLGRQINLFFLKSLYGSDMSIHGAYPLSLVKDIYTNNNKNIKDSISEYSAKSTASLSIDTSLSGLNSNEHYDVLKLEYFDTASKAYLYPQDRYRSMQLPDRDNEIRTQRVLFPDGYEQRTPVEINLSSFNKAEKEIQKNYKSAEATYISVIPRKGYSMEDFLKSKYLKRISGSGVFIQSKETVFLQYTINKYHKNRSIVIRTGAIAIALFIFAVLSYIFLLAVKRDYIKTLLGYGFSRKQMNDVICTIAISPIRNIVCVLICFFVNIILIKYYGNRIDIINILPGMACGAVLLVTSLTIRLITGYATYRISSWENRN